MAASRRWEGRSFPPREANSRRRSLHRRKCLAGVEAVEILLHHEVPLHSKFRQATPEGTVNRSNSRTWSVSPDLTDHAVKLPIRVPQTSVTPTGCKSADLKPVYFSDTAKGSRPALFSAGAAAAEARKAMRALPASG